jgi:hypothetical protein
MSIAKSQVYISSIIKRKRENQYHSNISPEVDENSTQEFYLLCIIDSNHHHHHLHHHNKHFFFLLFFLFNSPDAFSCRVVMTMLM